MRHFGLKTFIVLFLTGFLSGGCGKGEDEDSGHLKTLMDSSADEKPRSDWKIKKGQRDNERIRINPIPGSLAEVFNDSNAAQYRYALKLGIEPIQEIGDSYFTKRPLVKVTSNDAYYVDELTHSAPFLVPEAAALLRHIGVTFIDSLGSRGADGYRIKVTSLLRTRQSVKSLKKKNINATDSSTHQFGTTFDISWSSFICSDPSRTINPEDLKNLLAEVLKDARNEGRCLVKYERKSACFHITAIK